MRRFNILFAFAFILLTSCFTDEVDYVGYQPSSKGGIHIIGAVEDYDVKSVGTRADDGDIADSYISEMTMFIFKGDGTLIQGYKDKNFTDEDNKCTSAINIQRGNPTFLIDTEEGILADLSGSTNSSEVFYNNTANDLTSCDIYIVANAWHQLILKDDKGNRYIDNIKSLADLEAFVYNVDSTLAMPKIDNDSFRGFPMIGKQQGASFDLREEGNNDNNSVATIPLKKLYSKVCFTMQINADQVVAGQTPSFKIDHVEVFNVPNRVRMGRELDANGKPVYGDTNADDYLTEMGVASTTTPGDYYHFTKEPFTINSFNKRTISHSTSLTTDDVIEFSFYMPEHKVTPNSITYPWKAEQADEYENFRQYFKPVGVGQSRNGDSTTSAAKIATFVRIFGSYTDHNGQILGVQYDIYLGQNNYDDFTVKRNQQLNNKLIITGLTNHKHAYNNEDINGDGKIDENDVNISIDHRVEVSDRGFNLSMERTAILDAHFEVRPLDIELQPDATMTVTIPDAYKSWVAMEDDAVAYGNTSGLYVNTTTARKGVRKYFTTNLVSELNTANKGEIHLENTTTQTKMFRIWFYVDENPNVYDKLWKEGDPKVSYAGAVNDVVTVGSGDTAYTINKTTYRVCPVQFAYNYEKKDENGEVVEVITKTETINFQQWNLWRVWSAPNANGVRERYYDIEHEEEYLNNYASDQQYGQTHDGMPWGLDKLQLSDTDKAFYVQSYTDWGAITRWFSTKAEPYKYDFYISAEESNVIDYMDEDNDNDNKEKIYHPYNGLEFTKKIVAKAIATTNPSTSAPYIDKFRMLNEDAESAIEYCYLKNKRNPETNEIDVIKWYLPSVDEIEDITIGAYDEFDKVFQNNLYWASQPAYIQKAWNGTFWIIITLRYSGYLYVDNVNYARSTKVVFNGMTYVPASSEMSNTNISVNLGDLGWGDGTATESTNDNVPVYGDGYKARTESCRIRAVYRSGTNQ